MSIVFQGVASIKDSAVTDTDHRGPLGARIQQLFTANPIRWPVSVRYTAGSMVDIVVQFLAVRTHCCAFLRAKFAQERTLPWGLLGSVTVSACDAVRPGP